VVDFSTKVQKTFVTSPRTRPAFAKRGVGSTQEVPPESTPPLRKGRLGGVVEFALGILAEQGFRRNVKIAVVGTDCASLV
jgi:hypothetical protein